MADFLHRCTVITRVCYRQVFFSSCIRICKAKIVFSKHIKPAELRMETHLWRQMLMNPGSWAFGGRIINDVIQCYFNVVQHH